MENTAYVVNGYRIDTDASGDTWEVRDGSGRVVCYARSQRLAEAFAREN